MEGEGFDDDEDEDDMDEDLDEDEDDEDEEWLEGLKDTKIFIQIYYSSTEGVLSVLGHRSNLFDHFWIAEYLSHHTSRFKWYKFNKLTVLLFSAWYYSSMGWFIKLKLIL